MVRVAALKHAVEEGDTEPDLAGLRPRQQLSRGRERAHEMVERLGKTLTEEILPALAERGIRIWPHEPTSRSAQRAFLGRYFRAEVLPALTPLAIDVSRPFPQLANLSLNLALLLAPAGGRGAAAAGRGPGAGRPAPAGASAGRRRQHLRAARGDHPRRAGRALPRADRSWRSRPSASRATRRWSSTTKAGATTWRPSRRSCASGAAAGWCAWRSSRGSATPCSGSWCSGWRSRSPTSTASAGPLDMRALWPLVELPALEELREPAFKPQVSLEPARAQRTSSHRSTERDILLHHPYESFDPVAQLRVAGRRRPRRAGHQADALPHERRHPDRAGAGPGRGERASR